MNTNKYRNAQSEEVLRDVAFNTYTEFFTHTQQICFHLQSQIWHESTENTISRLADNSAEVATSLEMSSEIAREMVQQQNHSLKNQEELLRNERLLRENMQKSVIDVQKSHAETKNIIREQRVLFAEVFDRVAALQKTVLGEFTSVYTFGFYVGAAFLAYIITSTARTKSARFWLFALITLNFATERAVTNYHLEPSFSGEGSTYAESTVLPDVVYNNMWMCRKIYSCIALFTMLVCIVRYKDYNKINYNLLNEIKRQNAELQTLLKEQGITSIHSISELNTPKKPTSQEVALMEPGVSPLNKSDHHMTMVAYGNNVRDSSFSTNTSAMSYNSDNDSTFIAHNSDSDESSISSYTTGHNYSRNSFNESITSMVRSFRSSTPAVDGNRSRSSRSRRSSVASNISLMEQLNESVAQAEGIIVGGHNLRRRRTIQPHPINESESVSQFIGAVAKMTARRRKMLR
uniref:Protein brambleberry n=1 Tax=Ciona savignyi TaxID=51511 RepID=H2ZMM0_CIOSA